MENEKIIDVTGIELTPGDMSACLGNGEHKDKDGNPIEVDQASTFDVYRWDNRINKWVPGGLHYDGGKWEKFNLKSIYSNITSTNLFAKYSGERRFFYFKYLFTLFLCFNEKHCRC